MVAKTKKRDVAIPADVVTIPDSPTVSQADPSITLSYSQLAALVQSASASSLEAKAQLQRLLHDARVAATPELHTLTKLPPEIQRAVDAVKEPRRQRKARTMAARVGYVLQKIQTKGQFAALQTIVPGEAQVLSYVGTHHRPGVSEIAVGTTLSVKTVKNCCHTLVQKKLIESVPL